MIVSVLVSVIGKSFACNIITFNVAGYVGDGYESGLKCLGGKPAIVPSRCCCCCCVDDDAEGGVGDGDGVFLLLLLSGGSGNESLIISSLISIADIFGPP